MTAPVNKKYLKEFEPKIKKRGCFGFLKGRIIKKREDYFIPLTRSPCMDDVRLSEYIKHPTK